jgi:hypothetical protein
MNHDDDFQYYQNLEQEEKLLSPKHTNAYLIEVFGKTELLEMIREKVVELNTDRRALSPYYNRKLRYFSTRPRIYADYVSYEFKRKVEDIDAQLDRLSSLYLTITSSPLKNNPNHLTDTQIEQAKEYPTHTLYDGRLIKSGRTFRGKCPFHTERTPSFYFYDNGSYHCFGCAKHGSSAISYVMETEKLTFPEAVRRLI